MSFPFEIIIGELADVGCFVFLFLFDAENMSNCVRVVFFLYLHFFKFVSSKIRLHSMEVYKVHTDFSKSVNKIGGTEKNSSRGFITLKVKR